ncbi:hypothetical protein ACH347_16170 [Saccharopolyspora sp. 5N102]|uniref:hypothetical protein n=1 Tax=Saccharopolyspora sp. 5N102 TaxID=3375155 RepID=UPI0037AC33F0
MGAPLEGLLKTRTDLVDDVADQMLALAVKMTKAMEELEAGLQDLSNNAGGIYADNWRNAQKQINDLERQMDESIKICGQLTGDMSENNRIADLRSASNFQQ